MSLICKYWPDDCIIKSVTPDPGYKCPVLAESGIVFRSLQCAPTGRLVSVVGRSETLEAEFTDI